MMAHRSKELTEQAQNQYYHTTQPPLPVTLFYMFITRGETSHGILVYYGPLQEPVVNHYHLLQVGFAACTSPMRVNASTSRPLLMSRNDRSVFVFKEALPAFNSSGE